MDYATLESARLGDVDDSSYYAASRVACFFSGGRSSLLKLLTHLGPHFMLKDVRPRLKCERCGKRRAIITFWSPDHGGGSLAYLFEQDPGA